MNENQLAENIVHYRRKKGLSQEKVSEYMEVSRQAVTKWENGISRPSSDHLIKLAELFEINLDTLLGNKEEEKLLMQPEISTGKAPWIFIGISILCISVYVTGSALLDIFSIGAFICMFILCIPIQLFLHLYFSHAVKNDSFSTIAGFDNKTEYNIRELKKMLVQIDLHIGIISANYVFMLCAVHFLSSDMKWLSGFLIAAYALNLITAVMITNYKMADKIYLHDDDKKRAKRSMPITIIYILLLFIGTGITGILFEIKGKIKGIENNTMPAIKICGLLLLGITAATTGFLSENNRIKKWDPADMNYKPSRTGIAGLLICVILYGLICIL